MTRIVNTDGTIEPEELPNVFLTMSFLNPDEGVTHTEVIRIDQVHDSESDKGPHVFVGRENVGLGPVVKITVEYPTEAEKEEGTQ